MKITRTAPVSHRSEYDLLAVSTSGLITWKVAIAVISAAPSVGRFQYCEFSAKSAPHLAIPVRYGAPYSGGCLLARTHALSGGGSGGAVGIFGDGSATISQNRARKLGKGGHAAA